MTLTITILLTITLAYLLAIHRVDKRQGPQSLRREIKWLRSPVKSSQSRWLI